MGQLELPNQQIILELKYPNLPICLAPCSLMLGKHMALFWPCRIWVLLVGLSESGPNSLPVYQGPLEILFGAEPKYYSMDFFVLGG